jgi:hypothetical protein
MITRFVVEFIKATAIIVGLPLVSGLLTATIAFRLSDRDVGGTFGSGLLGFAVGAFALVIAITIVMRRIADIED